MKYLDSNPDILGGDLVIAGTRIGIDVVLRKLAAGEDVEKQLQGWPWLDERTLRGAIDKAITRVAATTSASAHA